MTKEEIKNRIATSNDRRTIECLIDEIMAMPVPWLFINKFGNEAIQKYQVFRTYMASVFKMPATAFFICGSSMLGFSLSPHKSFADFNEDSDVDIAIISSKLFNEYWKRFFYDYTNSVLTGKVYTEIAKNVFKHFIDFHTTYAQTHPYYLQWQKKTSDYAKDLQIKFDFPEEISYRIYSSYEDYRENLIKTIYDIKEKEIRGLGQ